MFGRIALATFVHVDAPTVGLEGHERDLGPGEARELVECLVSGPEDDDVVPRLEHGGEEDPDRLVGAGEDDDLVWIDVFVELGDLGA